MEDGVQFILEYIIFINDSCDVGCCFSLCFMVPAACSLFPQRWLVVYNSMIINYIIILYINILF